MSEAPRGQTNVNQLQLFQVMFETNMTRPGQNITGRHERCPRQLNNQSVTLQPGETIL